MEGTSRRAAITSRTVLVGQILEEASRRQWKTHVDGDGQVSIDFGGTTHTLPLDEFETDFIKAFEAMTARFALTTDRARPRVAERATPVQHSPAEKQNKDDPYGQFGFNIS